MIKKIPNGVYPTMITPFTSDNKIDYNAVEQILEWYASKKVDGIFAICQSSEIFALSFEERLELIDFIMKHRPEGVAIVASGHCADDLDRQAYEANKIIETGVDAYVFISNRFAKADEDDDVLLKNMYYVIDRLPEIALGVYECPYPYKRLLSPYVLSKMAQDPKFQFIKDTCCSIPQLKKKLDTLKGSELRIFNANAATLLQSLKDGAAGFSGIMANFYPEIIGEECRCFESDPDRAQKLQDFAGFCSAAEGQAYSCNAKYFLQMEGLNLTTKSRLCDENKLDALNRISTEQLHGMVSLYRDMFKIG